MSISKNFLLSSGASLTNFNSFGEKKTHAKLPSSPLIFVMFISLSLMYFSPFKKSIIIEFEPLFFSKFINIFAEFDRFFINSFSFFVLKLLPIEE